MSACPQAALQLRQFSGGNSAIIASGRITNEELWLTRKIADLLDVRYIDIVPRRGEGDRRARQLHGLTRTLVANMIQGVTVGFTRSLDIAGVGYKAELKGKEIHLALGFSHPVVYPLPEGVSAEYDAKGNRLTVKGADKHQIGLVAAEIRKLRPPEPYKGKGVRYAGEHVARKVGKRA